MPSQNYSNGIGTYANSTATAAVPDSNIDPATTVATGDVVDTAAVAPASPLSSFIGGVGGVLLFPGRVLVSPFVAGGDPMDASHLPITVLLSAAAWYGAYWYFFDRKKHKGQE